MDIILDRVMKATAVAVNRERAVKAIAGAIITIERIDRLLSAIAVVIFRERVMKAIVVTIALLVVAIALPSSY